MGGLKEWFKQDWVDIGAKKKGGGFKKNPNIKEKILPKKKKNRLEELRKELG